MTSRRVASDTAMTASALSRRGPLAKRRQGIAGPQLFGLPGPERLQAMGGHHMGDVVEQLGQMAPEVGVPGVAVDQVDALDVGRHPQADRHGAQGGAVPVRRESRPTGW